MTAGGRFFLLRGIAATALAVVAALSGTLMTPRDATAQSRASNGWQEESGGMMHYSGLHCPDRIASLTRIDILGSLAEVRASCVYQANDLETAIEILEPNKLGPMLDNLRERYLDAGFAALTGEGAAGLGVTFEVGRSGSSGIRETFWPVRVDDSDYILWVNYLYPSGQPEAELIYRSFVTLLRSYKPAH